MVYRQNFSQHPPLKLKQKAKVAALNRRPTGMGGGRRQSVISLHVSLWRLTHCGLKKYAFVVGAWIEPRGVVVNRKKSFPGAHYAGVLGFKWFTQKRALGIVSFLIGYHDRSPVIRKRFFILRGGL